MTAQKKLMLKIAIVMIFIVGAPILYFLSIGENPFFDESSGTKQIAIVNEDTGASREESVLDFGKEVAPILSTDSTYDWSVVSRSVAEKGLAKQDYDAILYIPSNFSKNIMSYEEQQPVKAEFKYTVSGQLNTANREKVLREIDKATARINGKVSTLYWSYVSQDLEKVRQEFDSILQKEQEFLDTISDFYGPDLASVVGDIENQKSMLGNLLSSINNVPFEGNIEQAEQFQESLAQFLTYVNQYREYQTSQQQLLKALQSDNVAAVMDLKSRYGPRYQNLKTYLTEQNNKLSKNMQALRDQLALNQQNVTHLGDEVVKQRDEIINLLVQVEGEMLVQYETQVIQLKNQLTGSAPKADPTQQASNGGDQGNTTNLIETSKIAALDTEREKLLSLVQEISSLKEQVAATPETGAEEETSPATESSSAVNDQLTQMSTKITDIEETIKQIQQQEQQLQQQLVQSQSELSEEDEEDVAPTPESIIREIERKETEILNSKLVYDSKKERLNRVFSKWFNSEDTDLLLEYYGALGQYESALMTSLSSGSNYKEVASSVNKILGISEDGNTYLQQLQAGVPTSQKQLATLEEGMTTFFTNYMEDVDLEYESISKQLDVIATSAGNVQESLDALMTGTQGTSMQASDGNALLLSHQSISQSLQSMNASMNNITKSQQTIMSVTDQLQSNASNVNADTSELVFKWNENVGTTREYRNDIHDVLNNAFIDGQKNGQIYDHLSTPLSANSLDQAVQEDKMPPVIVLVIVLISSLLIGYCCYYFKNNKTGVRVALFILLNLIVGLIISIYGLDIYPLNGSGAIEWTIFTILLLTAVSSVIFAGFSVGQLFGWFVNVAVITFFVTPMLTLLATNIDYEDPMSKVYLSIQYGPESLIVPASIVIVVIIGIAVAVPYVINRMKNRANPLDEEATYEA